MKKVLFFLLLILALAACGGNAEGTTSASVAEDSAAEVDMATADTAVSDPAVTEGEGVEAAATAVPDTAVVAAAQPETAVTTLTEDYPDALPLRTQLLVGTLKLEDSLQAVSPEQAQELVLLWQASRALSRSGTGASEEVTAVLNQIQQAMTAEQITAIAAMQLTRADTQSLTQAYDLSTGSGDGSGPEGGQGQGQNLSAEEQATRQAEKADQTSTGASEALMDLLIQILEARTQS